MYVCMYACIFINIYGEIERVKETDDRQRDRYREIFEESSIIIKFSKSCANRIAFLTWSSKAWTLRKDYRKIRMFSFANKNN